MNSRKVLSLLVIFIMLFANISAYGSGVTIENGVANNESEAVTTIETNVSSATENKTTPIGKVNLSIEKRTIGKGDLLPLTQVDIYEGDTPWDVLKRKADADSIQMEYRYYEKYNSMYVASIAGDGEFDHGSGSGWKYEVNGVFPQVGLSAYKGLKAGDTIRLRYCITANSPELNNPLVDYLKELIQETKTEYKESKYTTESYNVLKSALNHAQTIADNEEYNSKETDKELVVSTEIGKIKAAIKGLKEKLLLPGVGSGVPDDFQNDIWLKSNFIELKVDQSYKMVARRVEEIIDDPINNNVTHPDYNYEIISGDSIEIQTINSKKNMRNIVAKKTGTTVVAVSYNLKEAKNKTYGATSSVNVAYFVVNVTDGANTGIEINSNIAQRSYDTIYFDKGDTVEYEFEVNVNGNDSVVVTCNGKTITPNGNTYVANLENRSNIIGIEASNSKGTKKKFYVVDARKVEINIENLTRQGSEIQVGDEVGVSFRGITLPVYKLATIYNPTWKGNFFGEVTNGTYVEYKNTDLGTVKGKATQYKLPTQNKITFTATKAGTYRFNKGRIFSEWWGYELGKDKIMDEKGSPQLSAPTHSDYFSTLPDLEVTVKQATNVPASSIDIVEENVQVEVNNIKQLHFNVLPDNATQKSVTWTSNNQAIAIVNDKGVITGKKEGQAIITATSVDGGFTDTCNVTVTKKTPPTVNVSISPQSITAGSEVTITLSPVNNPEGTGVIRELRTKYSSNIPGLSMVSSENAKRDVTKLKIIKFTVPQGTPVGEYNLTNGHVYKKWGGVFYPPNFWLEQPKQGEFYKGELPNITINVQ